MSHTNQNPPQGHQTAAGRFRRFPKSGERDPVTGLSLSVLTKWRNLGHIQTAVVKLPGASKGVVMLDGDSLTSFLASCVVGPEGKAADTSAAVNRRKELTARRRAKWPKPSASPELSKGSEKTEGGQP